MRTDLVVVLLLDADREDGHTAGMQSARLVDNLERIHKLGGGSVYMGDR